MEVDYKKPWVSCYEMKVYDKNTGALCSATEGLVEQITLPNGKFYYVPVNCTLSRNAKKKGFESKTVEYFGNCTEYTLNERVKTSPIYIDGINVKTFLEKIATVEEARSFL